MAITIVGLGPGDSSLWTQAAYRCLHGASSVYLRTANHPSVVDIPCPHYSFETWFTQTTAIESVVERIAHEIIRLAQTNVEVVYALPGHPLVGEATVPLIRRLAEAETIPVQIIAGVSFLEPVFTVLNINPLHNLQLVDAIEIAKQYHPPLNPDHPALIARLYGEAIAQQLQETLLNLYPSDFEITLIRAAGQSEEAMWTCQMADLAHQPNLDAWLTVYLPPNPQHDSFVTFQQTIAHLLSPQGCPWDRKQTHQTLRPYLLEETYETLEALDNNDMDGLAEEMGDVLLQIALHTQMATRDGQFMWGDVISHINRKMLRRHPHVFGEVQVEGVEEVLSNWETIKQAEKAAKGHTKQSALDGIPPGLPALAQALMISKKAVKAGFEWDDVQGVLDKVIEEAREIAAAENLADEEAEIGDLFFSVVNLARWRNLDPESALRAMNVRFIRRFHQMEQLLTARQQQMTDLTTAQKLALWQDAKAQLREVEQRNG